MKESILIVDDDASIHTGIKMALYSEGYLIKAVTNLKDALMQIKNESPQLVLLDVHFPEGSGLTLLEELQNAGIEIPVLLISGAATASEAVKGIKLGAYDYLEKPLSADRLRISIRRCLDFHKKTAMLNSLTQPYAGQNSIIGNSEVMVRLRQQISKIALENIRVLITGESGTGKEVVAQSLWQNSKRVKSSFVIVNSAAIPDSLMESELFGHKKGSFTGALSDRAGKIEMADKGTLFLDEIGDLSLPAQAKLLRFLENNEVQRVGDTHLKKVDVRVIAATSKNLEEEVAQGRFRSDLFYRLNVARLQLPALREHKEDIPQLFQHFLLDRQKQNQDQIPIEIAPEALQLLQIYTWPGNVRELRNFADMLQLTGKQFIDSTFMQNLLNSRFTFFKGIKSDCDKTNIVTGELNAMDFVPLKKYKNTLEKQYIEKVLNSVEGSVSKAARILEIDRSYLHQKLSGYSKK